MAIPSTAVVWADPMDPYDITDYKIDASSILQSGESISNYTINLTADAVLLGLQVGTGNYAPSILGTTITIWLSIADGHQQDAAFTGAGVTLPLEINITTNSIPTRRRQRTVVVKVAQQ